MNGPFYCRCSHYINSQQTTPQAPASPDDFVLIIDEINRKLFKNRIANARDRRELKFRKEVQLVPRQHQWHRFEVVI